MFSQLLAAAKNQRPLPRLSCCCSSSPASFILPVTEKASEKQQSKEEQRLNHAEMRKKGSHRDMAPATPHHFVSAMAICLCTLCSPLCSHLGWAQPSFLQLPSCYLAVVLPLRDIMKRRVNEMKLVPSPPMWFT